MFVKIEKIMQIRIVIIHNNSFKSVLLHVHFVKIVDVGYHNKQIE